MVVETWGFKACGLKAAATNRRDTGAHDASLCHHLQGHILYVCLLVLGFKLALVLDPRHLCIYEYYCLSSRANGCYLCFGYLEPFRPGQWSSYINALALTLRSGSFNHSLPHYIIVCDACRTHHATPQETPQLKQSGYRPTLIL